MAVERTTVMMDSILFDRVQEHIKETGETLTDFYNRAIVNLLEKDGDFEIRDIWEESINACIKKQD